MFGQYLQGKQKFMSNQRKFISLTLALFALASILSACGNNQLEQDLAAAEEQIAALATENADSVNQAAAQIEAAATENAEAINAAATTAANALSNAQNQALDAISSAQATADALSASATAEASPPVNYDTSTYGIIDNLNLNGVRVTWWHQHQGGRETELITIIDEFNAINEYGIVVEASNEGGYGDIYDKMIAGFATKEIPSLVVAYQNQAASYQVNNGLVNLDPYINHPIYGLNDEERSDFFASFLNADRLPQFNNESFGFPPNRSMELLYYNQTWLKELGYDSPPRTPEEFQEVACAASEPGAGTIGYEISTDASRVASLIFAHEGEIYDYNNNTFTFFSGEAVDALTLIQEMYDDGCAILIAEDDGDQIDFSKERVLFIIGSSSSIPEIKALVEAEAEAVSTEENPVFPFDWSVAPIPYSGYQPVQNIYGASVSIPKTSPEEQLAAWLFLKYYTSIEVQARWATASNYFPVRASVAEEMQEYIAENPPYGTAFDLLEYGKTEPPVAGYDNVRDEVTAAYIRILEEEEADVATILRELDEIANQILVESAPE